MYSQPFDDDIWHISSRDSIVFFPTYRLIFRSSIKAATLIVLFMHCAGMPTNTEMPSQQRAISSRVSSHSSKNVTLFSRSYAGAPLIACSENTTKSADSDLACSMHRTIFSLFDLKSPIV